MPASQGTAVAVLVVALVNGRATFFAGLGVRATATTIVQTNEISPRLIRP